MTLYANDPNPDSINFYLNGNFIRTDPNTSGTRSAIVDLGSFANNGIFPLVGQAQDSQGGWSNSVNRTLTVLNVAPTLTGFALNGSESDITIDEGQSVSGSLLATDPGLYDDITFLVNGNNKGIDPTDTIGTRTIGMNLDTFYDDTSVTYTASARDSDGADSNAIARTVTVRNVAPTLTHFDLFTDTIDEGQSVYADLLATDPGADAINFLINGNSIGINSNMSGARYMGTNLGLFGNQGTFTFQAQTVDDDNGVSNIIEKTLTVRNVAPTITSLITPTSVSKGSLFDFTAAAIDPGINDLLAYDWDFDNDGDFDDFTGISGQKLFDTSGLFKVALRVADGDGGFDYRYFEIESVPEPSSGSGVVALGVLGIGSLLLRKKR